MSGAVEKRRADARPLWFLMGFLSIGSQVILLRAGMVAFSGNEMVVGPMLFAWTAWIGIGSLVGRGLGGGGARRKMHILLGVAAVLLPVTYFFTYLAKLILRLPPAVLVSPYRSFGFFVAALAPLCLVLGASFAGGCRLPRESAGRAVARTYLWEALGAAAGGLAAGGMLLPVLSSTKAVFILAAVTFTALAWDGWRNRITLLHLMALWAALAVAAVIMAIWNAPYKAARKIAWRGYPVIAERDSRYANLMMVEREGEYTLFINGAPAVSWPGGPSSETLAYLALTVNPLAKRVLLIGGGLTTVGAKLLDGPVERLDYCQLDPEAVEMEKLVPSPAWRDKRVRLHVEDGRRFVRTAPPKSFDLVVLDVGDPDSLAQNRYYTAEFFKQVGAVISNDGALIFGIGEYANYISDQKASFLASIEQAAGKTFPTTFFYPLDRFYFAAAFSTKPPENVMQIDKRLKALGLSGRYFRVEKLRYDLAQERYKSYYEALRRARNIPTNTDYRPVGYAYRTNVWMGQFHGDGGWESLVSGFRPVRFLILLFMILVAGWIFSGKRGRSWTLAPLVFGVGFAGMAMEMLAIYATQVTLGALYGYIGLITAVFMLGLSFGAAASHTKTVNKNRMFLILFYLLFVWVVYVAGDIVGSASRSASILFITKTVFVVSGLAGIIFGMVAAWGEEKQTEAGKLGGLLNFADLSGAALAALVLPLLIIPIRGTSYAMRITVFLALSCGLWGVLYVWTRGKGRRKDGTETS